MFSFVPLALGAKDVCVDMFLGALALEGVAFLSTLAMFASDKLASKAYGRSGRFRGIN